MIIRAVAKTLGAPMLGFEAVPRGSGAYFLSSESSTSATALAAVLKTACATPAIVLSGRKLPSAGASSMADKCQSEWMHGPPQCAAAGRGTIMSQTCTLSWPIAADQRCKHTAVRVGAYHRDHCTAGAGLNAGFCTTESGNRLALPKNIPRGHPPAFHWSGRKAGRQPRVGLGGPGTPVVLLRTGSAQR